MSSEERRLYVVAYDIPDDRRRARVAKVLEGYGDRLQYSVFVVVARPAKLVRLRDALAGEVESGEDSIALFDLGVHGTQRMQQVVTFIGLKRDVTPTNAVIL